MIFPLKVPGFDGRIVGVRITNFLFKVEVILDGKIALRTGSKGGYSLKRADKSWAEVMICRGFFLDPLPEVEIDGIRYRLAPPLPWYEWLCASLPFAGIPLGGITGGILGIVGLFINLRFFRVNSTAAMKITLTSLVTLTILGIDAILYSL